ncbi:unnamed protein product [Dovyalis caffra]|uniref:Uncharacterized protein n=1 Tax=Dovyalis caffra TaxID=77055 RepID=A0AAV1SK54_9ROSI|nr:unnamed protein product [Dovyalis caffra]
MPSGGLAHKGGEFPNHPLVPITLIVPASILAVNIEKETSLALVSITLTSGESAHEESTMIDSEEMTSSSSPAMKKSFSVGCLPSSSTTPPSSTSSNSARVNIGENFDLLSNGYLSDGQVGRTPERKKGVPWTEEEHRNFLLGLEKLGKGDWRGISRSFVTTRTPTQVGNGNSIKPVNASISEVTESKNIFGGLLLMNTVASPISTGFSELGLQIWNSSPPPPGIKQLLLEDKMGNAFVHS